MQKNRKLPGGVFGQGIISPAEAPVVHQGPLTEGVDLHHVVDAAALGQLSRRLAFGDDAAEQAVVDALVIQQMPVPRRHQLGGEQAGHEVDGDAVLDHPKQLPVEKEQLLHGGHLWRHNGLQVLILLVEQIAERTQQGVLAIEIMVEGPFRRLRGFDDLLHRRVLIALVIEQPPGGFHDAPPRVSGVFLCHAARPSSAK